MQLKPVTHVWNLTVIPAQPHTCASLNCTPPTTPVCPTCFCLLIKAAGGASAAAQQHEAAAHGIGSSVVDDLVKAMELLTEVCNQRGDV